MARFKYIGEVVRSWVVSYGPTLKFRFRLKDGTVHELNAPTSAGFVKGEDLGVEITNERVLRHLRSDPRFEEIVKHDSGTQE